MKRIAHYRPSGAMLVAIVAVVIASAGSATAASLITSGEIKNNTIRSGDIRNNTIRGKDVHTGTIRSSDVGDGSLLASDFAAGQLPQGAQGAQGPRGAAGRNGFGVLDYPDTVQTIADNHSAEVTVACPAGTSATGGDAFVNDATDKDVTNQVVISQGFRFNNPIGWSANMTNHTGADVTVAVDAACANADTVMATSNHHRHR